MVKRSKTLMVIAAAFYASHPLRKAIPTLNKVIYALDHPLIAHGAPMSRGNTALMLTMVDGHAEAVVPLRAGCESEGKDSGGETTLPVAADSGQAELVELKVTHRERPWETEAGIFCCCSPSKKATTRSPTHCVKPVCAYARAAGAVCA